MAAEPDFDDLHVQRHQQQRHPGGNATRRTRNDEEVMLSHRRHPGRSLERMEDPAFSLCQSAQFLAGGLHYGARRRKVLRTAVHVTEQPLNRPRT